MKRYQKNATLQPCNVCSLQLWKNQTDEHLVVFHPEVTSLIQKLYKKLKGVPKVHAFPTMDCSNLCATKILANYLIVDIVENEPGCLVLVKQLSEKLETLSDFSFVSNKQMLCYLCGLNLLSTTETITHLTLQHPEYLALVLFLRFRPLSELNFHIHKLADNLVTSEKLIQRIDGNRVLGVRQPIIQIKKLPDHLYHECIAKGFIKLKKNNRTWSPYDPQPNPRLNRISAIVIKKMKETTTKSSIKKNHVIAPGNVSNSLQENFDPQPNPRLNRIDPTVKQNMKETATKSSKRKKQNMKKTATKSSKKKNIVIAPGNMSHSLQENFDPQPKPRLNRIDPTVKQNMKETATKSSKRKKQNMKKTATKSSKKKNPVIAPGNVSNSLQENFDPQPNPRLNRIDPTVKQNMKETATKSSKRKKQKMKETATKASKKKNPVVAPMNLSNSFQDISNSKMSSQYNEKDSVELAPGNTLNLHQENSEVSSLSNAKNHDELPRGNTVNSPSEDTDFQECIILNAHQENSNSEESSLSNAKNHDELAPGNTVNSPSINTDSQECIILCSLKNVNSQTKSKVDCFLVKNVKMDQLRRQSEKEKVMKRQILIKKLIDKHHEKEARKEVVYWQRGLSVYVKRNQKYLGELEEQLLIARKLLRNVSGYESLLMQVNSNLESDKVRKTVKFYLKKIYKAIENVQTLVSKGDSSERMEQPLLQNHRSVSTPIDRSNKKFNSSTIDLVNSTLVTEDKQLIDCYYCKKLNCEGLHPEKFIN
ncbi:hypothetical protein JTE90_014422 [Oedothorax gibbosus]|uniref:C2H2-type domain-containing protein n=1 Tax=Oedothorax gibbosus TaxID=931172 RepID=A0AAV6V345_9ARAC|nr:hypothetical protein JTE90_014422 [Oedothorax gibbosus]